MTLHRKRKSVFAGMLLAVLALTGALADLGSADVVLIAPIGAGTTGGASMVHVSAAGGSGGSGGGTRGATLYFETANLDRGLPWDAIAATDWKRWHRQTASAGGRLPARLANGGDASSIERRLVASSCGRAPTTSGTCFLWANTCPDGAQALHRRSFDGPADRGQIACRTSDWQRAGREFHSLSSWGQEAHMDELSHWNVQIWREGESQPIFERRVALDASGRPLADADSAGMPVDWWRSGGALAGASNATAGGPLGAWRTDSDPDYQACASRYRSAPRLIVGNIDLNGKPAKVAYRNGSLGSKAPEVGKSTSTCYWGGWSNGGRAWLPGSSSRSTAPCAKCFYEGIELTWQIPRAESYRGGSVQANFSYRLLGRPNTFYAIRIVSLDHREQLLMTNTLQPKRHLYWSQYFRVFMPTGLAGFDYATPVCDCG